MKRFIYLPLCALMLLSIGLHAQKIEFGPHNDDAGANDQRFGSHYTPNGLPAFTPVAPHQLYRQLNPLSDDYIEVRFFVDFEILWDSVGWSYPYPDPEVEWAELAIEYHEECQTQCELRLNVYRLDDRVYSLTSNERWTQTEGHDDFPMNGGYRDPVTDRYFIVLRESAGSFKDIVQDAVYAHHLSLGFKLQDHPWLENCLRTINPAEMQLRIKFVDHSQIVKITNVIDAIEDNPLVPSAVRDEQTLMIWLPARIFTS